MFELGKVYRRRALHEEFKGQEQGGIVTPAGRPFAFLITGEGGHAYGYDDQWLEDGTFRYFGEGQSGDMAFVRGNLAIRDHAANGKDLHVFEKVPTAHLRYRGQFVCAGYELVPGVPGLDHAPRSAIVFLLAPIEGDDEDNERAEQDVAGLSLAELRLAALAAPDTGGEPLETKRKAYRRSAAVRAYVLARANGNCEGCGQPAPFVTAAGRPYLEPHHTRRISDGGPDQPAAVIALCPTCHRRAHYADDGQSYNAQLMGVVRDLEGAV